MNKTALILSGPTHEYLDPVRFIGNASSGLMGKAIAEEAIRRGYFVEFISGPVSPANIPQLGANGNIHRITSAEQMLEAGSAQFSSASVIIFAAAVADYAPAEKHSEKMSKSADDLVLHLRPTPDIAKTLCARKQPEQIAIGFALQTNDGEEKARRKLRGKNLDGIVLNSPATLGASNGTFSFLRMDALQFESWGCIDKQTCAQHIFLAVEQLENS